MDSNSHRLSLAEHLQRTAPQARDFLHSEAGKLFVLALESHARDSAYVAIHDDDPAAYQRWRAYALAVESVKGMLEAFAGMADAEKSASNPDSFRVPKGDGEPAF